MYWCDVVGFARYFSDMPQSFGCQVNVCNPGISRVVLVHCAQHFVAQHFVGLITELILMNGALLVVRSDFLWEDVN